MSRLLLIYGESTGRKITIPAAPDEQKIMEMLKILSAIKQKILGPVKIESDAMHALDMIYKSWPELEDQRFKHYSTRRFIHLIKLCLIHCAARVSSDYPARCHPSQYGVSIHRNPNAKAIGELGKKQNI